VDKKRNYRSKIQRTQQPGGWRRKPGRGSTRLDSLLYSTVCRGKGMSSSEVLKIRRKFRLELKNKRELK
jgi:hypothetical protein